MHLYRKQKVIFMSKKIPIGISVVITLIAVACSSVITIFAYLNKYSELIDDLPQRSALYGHLEDVDELVRSEYFGKVDDDKLEDNLVQGYLSGLGDSYCYYISPDNFEMYDNYMKGRMSGVGVTVYYEPSLTKLIVGSVDDYSPAAEAGIKKDMYIASVDNTDVNETNYSELISKLCDNYEGKVSFSYSQSEDNFSEIELKCGYNKKSCFYKTDSDIGYIRIESYYPTTVNEFSQVIEDLKNEGIKSVILDLRNSSGADLSIAADIIDLVVPVGNEGSGSLYTAVNENGDIVQQASSDSSALNIYFAVLVNDRTECAAELIACDLRDFGKAQLFGEKTAGHGTLQSLFRLDDGGAVYLTVAEIMPYLSDSFNEIGLSPDYEIITSESFKNQISIDNLEADEQYQRALAYLKNK